MKHRMLWSLAAFYATIVVAEGLLGFSFFVTLIMAIAVQITISAVLPWRDPTSEWRIMCMKQRVFSLKVQERMWNAVISANQTKIGIATIELPDNVDPLSVASVEWVANLLPSGIKVCDTTIRGQKIILAVAMGPTRPRGGRKRRIRVLKPGALPVGSEA